MPPSPQVGISLHDDFGKNYVLPGSMLCSFSHFPVVFCCSSLTFSGSNPKFLNESLIINPLHQSALLTTRRYTAPSDTPSTLYSPPDTLNYHSLLSSYNPSTAASAAYILRHDQVETTPFLVVVEHRLFDCRVVHRRTFN